MPIRMPRRHALRPITGEGAARHTYSKCPGLHNAHGSVLALHVVEQFIDVFGSIARTADVHRPRQSLRGRRAGFGRGRDQSQGAGQQWASEGAAEI